MQDALLLVVGAAYVSIAVLVGVIFAMRRHHRYHVGVQIDTEEKLSVSQCINRTLAIHLASALNSSGLDYPGRKGDKFSINACFPRGLSEGNRLAEVEGFPRIVDIDVVEDDEVVRVIDEGGREHAFSFYEPVAYWDS